LAELLDNARDAGAKTIKVDAIPLKCGWMMRVIDDGSGMDKHGIESMFDFGKTVKSSGQRVGKYGMGAKSGIMGIAKDGLVLTAKDGRMAVTLLSQTLHVKHSLEQVSNSLCCIVTPTIVLPEIHFPERNILSFNPHR